MKKLFSALLSLSLLAGAAAMPVSAAETYSLGDVDMNGVVDSTDSVMVLYDYVQMILQYDTASEASSIESDGHTLTEDQLICADVTGDNAVDTGDALVILSYYVYTLVADEPMAIDAYYLDFANSNDYDVPSDIDNQVVSEWNDNIITLS